MIHNTYQSFTHSSFRHKEFEVGLHCSYVLLRPLGRAQFWPQDIIFIWTNLVEIHKIMPYTTYESSTPSSFREPELWSWFSLSYVLTGDPRVGSILTPPRPGGTVVSMLDLWPGGCKFDSQFDLSGVFSPLTSAEACEESSRWLWKEKLC